MKLNKGFAGSFGNARIRYSSSAFKSEPKAKRLVVLDVDSTLIQNEVIDLLAEQAGCGAEVSNITELAMRGEIDFEESLRQRVSLLEGLDELGVERAWQNLKLTPGARTFCRTLGRLGFTTALVSGGFSILLNVFNVNSISSMQSK